jgi:hypothetical protein
MEKRPMGRPIERLMEIVAAMIESRAHGKVLVFPWSVQKPRSRDSGMPKPVFFACSARKKTGLVSLTKAKRYEPLLFGRMDKQAN